MFAIPFAVPFPFFMALSTTFCSARFRVEGTRQTQGALFWGFHEAPRSSGDAETGGVLCTALGSLADPLHVEYTPLLESMSNSQPFLGEAREMYEPQGVGTHIPFF